MPEAVIEARVEADQEAVRADQVNDAVNKILDALRSNGYNQPCASKMSRSTTPHENQDDHLRTSLTDDEHQGHRGAVPSLFRQSREITEDDHRRSSTYRQARHVITNTRPSHG
jgi:hypothetical protein